MNTTIKSLQALYVKNGGNLTDTYSDICGGAAVGNYTTIPDCVAACAKLTLGGSAYTLPTASASTKGGVKIGDGLTMDGEVLSATGGGLPADFPAESEANANKFIGFDANGDYEAKAAPSLPNGTNDGDILVWDGTDSEWDAAAPSKETFWVSGSFDMSTMTVSNLTKSYADIKAAALGGKHVLMKLVGKDLDNYDHYIFVECAEATDAQDQPVIFSTFVWTNLGSGYELLYYRLTVEYDGGVSLAVKKVTTSDLQ